MPLRMGQTDTVQKKCDTLCLAKVRNQERGGLAKGVSAESSLTPRRTKNTKHIGPSSTFGTQSATAKRGVHSCEKTLLKTPFSLFLIKEYTKAAQRLLDSTVTLRRWQATSDRHARSAQKQHNPQQHRAQQNFVGEQCDWRTGAPHDGNELRKYRVVACAHSSRALLYAYFNRSGSKGAFSFPGATWDHCRCAVEPSPSHIRCRTSIPMTPHHLR